MRFSRSAFCAVWLGVLCAVASALAQQRPLDNGSEALFDSIDSRLFVDVLPPRIESDSALPRLADLLPQAPLFTEQRESLFQLDFNGYDLEANPHRLVYLEPTALSLVSDDREGQALRIQTREPVVAGITRSLDPDRLAGQLIELSARVKLDGPFTVPPDALAWYGPVIQLRWERPHPDPAQRSQGENLREWRTIFDSLDGLRRPATFFPDSRFHTYRTRLSVPDDLTGAVLQVVVQNAMATMVVDDLSLSLVETRENRLLREAAARTSGNLIGPGAGFELGLTRGAVTTERLLSPAPGGASGRDFGDYQVVTDAAEGRAALAVTAQAGLSAALEMPWLGLAAGQPYAFSVWLRAARDGVKAAFGVTDGDWRILGTPVTLTTRWKRYAATFSPRRTHQQAHWPWVSIDAPESDVTVFVDGLQLERGAAPGAYQQPAPVELAVTDNFAPGPGLRHVYPEGQPMAVVGRLLSHGREPITVRLRAVLESHSGRLYRAVLDLPEEVVLPPEQLAEVPLHEGPLPRGLYRFWLVASHTGTGEVFRAEQIVAVLPAPRAERLGFHDGPG
ncbi:MAG: hypothetical protein HUU35_16030, partial [Armatimonadetes bacterium]|nr:hypothetical protein [Armatimonadota bacterium]